MIEKTLAEKVYDYLAKVEEASGKEIALALGTTNKNIRRVTGESRKRGERKFFVARTRRNQNIWTVKASSDCVEEVKVVDEDDSAPLKTLGKLGRGTSEIGILLSTWPKLKKGKK